MRPDDVAARGLAYAESDLAIACGVDPPRTHDLEVLLAAVPGSVDVVLDKAVVAALTVYAVAGRYPGDTEPVDADEHARAVAVASSVLVWARTVVAGLQDGQE